MPVRHNAGVDPYLAAERPGRATRLTDRDGERDVLDRLVGAVRAGESRVLVVRGDPGVGKTVLLDYLAGRARGCRVARAAGVQSEMELAFAGLHQLCAPMLDHLDRIPVPQRDALRTALGLAAGPPPDRFLVGLAVLSLLSEVAGGQPLICLIDDEQWLDRASELTLGFVARRLAADPVALVFATRDPGTELAGQPELVVAGLKDDHARALLDSALAGPLDARVRDLIIAETRGNPLALLELPRGLTPAELAGGFGLPAVTPLTGRIEASFGRQLDALPAQIRRLLQLAAADPSGDRALVWRAAERLGIGVQAGAPAVEAGLVEFDGHVRFRHPLTRSAAYRSAPLAERQQLHAALAEVTDSQLDPDRRAWHLAQAAPDQDEEVAAELERSAGRAQARGGVAAAAAFLERAALLTGDPARRAGRALAAAQAKVQAGASGAAQGMLAIAETGPLSDLEQARLELVRARLASATRRDAEAPLLLLRAAERLERIDIGLARATYLDAVAAAMFAGRLASPGGSTMDVARAAAAAPRPPGQGSYREAIDRLGRTRLRVELARAHLLYGEWLRRDNRRADARTQLRTAHEMLDAMGLAAFAGRARRELAATGETVRARTVDMVTALTAQEAYIARLACDGRTNAEIGAQLFLSVRTVEWHLRKIFIKLGIGSRRELRTALGKLGPDRPAA